MTSFSLLLPVAAVGQPLFGSQWAAMAVVCGGVALLLAAVRAVGQWLAATHPTPAVVRRPIAASGTSSGELIAAIAAAVTTVLGENTRIASVTPTPAPLPKPAPSVEVLMQQWSLEGRRQIYSSHKLR